MATRVLVPLADGCEELEAVTLIDLLRRAEFTVVTAGLRAGPITASRGVVLWPDTSIDHLRDEPFDLIALPGGTAGAARLAAHDGLAELLRRQDTEGRWTGAVCAAPAVLAAHGLLAGRRATAFPGALEAHGVESTGRALEVDGRMVTSRGPGTAMDFALALIEQIAGCERRGAVEGPLQRP
ncbi:MAG: DJ-1 family glyoxalase III [Halofilum sp. (in: g-proteobacteria)]